MSGNSHTELYMPRTHTRLTQLLIIFAYLKFFQSFSARKQLWYILDPLSFSHKTYKYCGHHLCINTWFAHIILHIHPVYGVVKQFILRIRMWSDTRARQYLRDIGISCSVSCSVCGNLVVWIFIMYFIYGEWVGVV